MKNKECNKIIEEYLFYTNQLKDLWGNKIYLELNKILNSKTIISDNNYNIKKRAENTWKAIKDVGNFLQENPKYREIIIDNYGNKDLLDNIKLTLTAYTYELTQNLDSLKQINIFTDRRSIICDL